MADNVTIPATGSGTATPAIATDDVSSVHYQKIKVDGGGDGLSVPIIAGQQLAAGSLPVVLTAAQMTTLTPVAALTDTQLRATAVPVSGTVTATVTGVSTAANQATEIASLASIDGKITAVNTGAVVVSSSALPSSASTSTKQSDGSQKTQLVDGSGNVIAATSNALNVAITAGGTGGGPSTVADGADVTQGAIADAAVTAGATGTISAKLRSISRDLLANIVLAAGANVIGAVTQSGSWVLAAGSALIGKVGIDQTTPGTTNLVALAANQSVNVAQINGVTPLMGAGNTGTGSPRVTIASDQASIAVVATPATVASATLANVASSATTVTLQASNASRKSWALFNDSTAVLYVKFGATASTTSYTVQMAAGAFYEMPCPVVYSGVIDGIWASANGNARVTEL